MEEHSPCAHGSRTSLHQLSLVHTTESHVIITPLAPEDAPAYFRLVHGERDRLRTYFPVTVDRCADERSTTHYVTELCALAKARQTCCYMVRSDPDSIPVGVVFLKNFDLRAGKCEAAYFTAESAQGQGFASDALAWAVDEAHRQLGLQRIMLRIAPDNAASIRVAEKNGFVQEGILRRDFRTSDGQLVDVVLYAKLR